MRTYHVVCSSRCEKCESSMYFAHREVKSGTYHVFCSSTTEKCECIRYCAHRELKRGAAGNFYYSRGRSLLIILWGAQVKG